VPSRSQGLARALSYVVLSLGNGVARDFAARLVGVYVDDAPERQRLRSVRISVATSGCVALPW
jgi:hypothetical protein